MLSSFIFTHVAVKHTNLPQKLSSSSFTHDLGHILKGAVTFCNVQQFDKI